MPAPNVICLVVDRLHAGYLGAYGNTWIATPAIDRLTAESLVFDRAVVDSPQLEVFYRSFWSGLHVACPPEHETGIASLPAVLSSAGFRTVLLTDEPAVAAQRTAGDFSEQIVVPAAATPSRVAGSIEETDAAAFFATAHDWLSQQTAGPFFAWLHTGTLARAWDAPLEFRRQYVDEDDPTAADWAEPPNRRLPAEFDPDERVAVAHAYAGQVSLLDQFIGSLLQSIDDAGPAAQTLFVLISPRGYPLGEHYRIGACDDALYAELARMAWLIRFPGGFQSSARTLSLVQPADLSATILDACGLPTPSAGWSVGRGRSLLPLATEVNVSGFDRSLTVAAEYQRRIETPAWALRVTTSTTGETAELFAKPDDWFEVNDVADRCPDVVAQLSAAAAEYETACKSAEASVLAPLSEQVAWGVE